MPTLARLSFWVSPEQMDAFGAAYERKILPVLRTHDLVESSERGRSNVEGVFSRLFEVETPSEVIVKERELGNDPSWQKLLRRLGTTSGMVGSDGLIRTHLGIYLTSAGPGKVEKACPGSIVKAGTGTRQGLWQNFDVSDGLPSHRTFDILQDREGNLWIATGAGGVSRYDGEEFITFATHENPMLEDREGNLWFARIGTIGGVSRYDGEEFVTFTTEDGLAHNEVRSISEDRGGNLWFGTKYGGVSRYDGEEFVTFTTEDGLAHNDVRSILEDRDGDFWFGTGSYATGAGGISRYDGEEFVTFTTEDGLAHNTVWSILEDWEGNLWFGTGSYETGGGGVSRYDGEKFLTFTVEDGLAGVYFESPAEMI